MQRIGGETLVLCADLREHWTFEAMRGVASLPGDFVAKTVWRPELSLLSVPP